MAAKTADGVHDHRTRNDTKSNAKKVSLDALQARLADGIDLALDVKQAHWNLKGPQFIGIHEMLDGFRDALDTYAVADHLAALIDRYAVFANAVRKNIDDTDDAGDAGTSDLFTEVSRGVDKQLWFLEAHVQEPTGNMRDGDGAGHR